jgi:hypothetical protein
VNRRIRRGLRDRRHRAADDELARQTRRAQPAIDEDVGEELRERSATRASAARRSPRGPAEMTGGSASRTGEIRIVRYSVTVGSALNVRSSPTSASRRSRKPLRHSS